MTGYASVQLNLPASEGTTESRSNTAQRLGLEIRSVNSRFLDLSFRLPDELRAFEPALRELVTQHIKRGKVEVRAVADSVEGTAIEPATSALQRLVHLQDKVKAWLPGARDLSVADVLRLSSQERGNSPVTESTLMPLALQAVQALLAARAREGARLATMLQNHIQQLRVLTQAAAPLIPELVEQQRNRFLDRWKEAMALTDGATLPEAAQDRALTEATAYAIRIDVAEELTRTASHLDEISRLIAKGGDMGKRLDFLIQELHREANTMGSKSAALELTKISVDMKVLIEQMREQVQNIE